MKKLYVGIDLGVRVCSLAVMDEKGDLKKEVEVQTSEKNLRKQVCSLKGEVHVMVEECELSGWVYRMLVDKVFRVVVCDPKRNAWIAKSSRKSDRVDAMKLAEHLRMNSFSEVYNPREESWAVFKKAVQHEEWLTHQVANLKQRIQHQFRREGVNYQGKSPFTKSGSEKLLEAISNPDMQKLIRHSYKLLELNDEEKKEARKRVRQLSAKIPAVSLLETAPGVGPVLSARFAAYVQTPGRFSSKRKLWKYSRFGVVDRTSDGKPLGRKRLEKCANGVLKDVSRKIFIIATNSRADNLFRRTYQRSLERTKNEIHARLNTQRKILSVLRAMWRDGTEYDDDIDKDRA